MNKSQAILCRGQRRKAARAAGTLQPRVHPELPVVTGPIWGIPADEVAAWIDSWDTDTPLPDPEARWIDLI
jgi:hypothetical protein